MIDEKFSIYQNLNVDKHLVPLSAVAYEVKNKNSLLSEENLLSLSYGKIVRKDIDSEGGLLPESFDGYNIIEAGDIVLRLTDLQNDKRSLRTGLVQEKGIITSAYTTIRPTKIDSRWLAYTLHSYDIQKVFYSLGSGLRQSMNFADLKNLPIFLPPIEDQLRVADYLDHQLNIIHKIEDFSNLLTKLMQEELRTQNELLFAATEAPRIPLRRIARLVTDKRVALLPTVSLDLVQARRGTLNVSELPITDGSTSTRMERGDIAFGKLRPYLGKVYLATDETFAESEFIVMRVDKNLLSQQYLSKYLLTRGVLNELESLSVGSKMPRTSWDQIASLMVPVPNMKLQDEICERIAVNESLANKKEEVLLKLSEKLDEYRISLISSVITGTFEELWEWRK